jgi:hypothetical protein
VARRENEPLIFSMRSRQSVIRGDPPELWLTKTDSPQKLLLSLVSNACRVSSEDVGVLRVAAMTVAKMGSRSLILLKLGRYSNWA